MEKKMEWAFIVSVFVLVSLAVFYVVMSLVISGDDVGLFFSPVAEDYGQKEILASPPESRANSVALSAILVAVFSFVFIVVLLMFLRRNRKSAKENYEL